MTSESTPIYNRLTLPAQSRLQHLRSGLLHLHKVLLEAERASYEAKHGRIVSSGQLLHLVMHDAWFDWLHRISEMIVQIDELLESAQASFDDAYKLLAEVRSLFQAPAGSGDFADRYRAVLQREPAAVLAHLEVQKGLYTDS